MEIFLIFAVLTVLLSLFVVPPQMRCSNLRRIKYQADLDSLIIHQFIKIITIVI
jgi:hypothetical protein